MWGSLQALGVLLATGSLAWFTRASGGPWRDVAILAAFGLAGAAFAFLAPAAYAAATLLVVVVAVVVSATD